MSASIGEADARPCPAVAEIDDLWPRLLLSPVVGVGIGRVSGLLGPGLPYAWGHFAALTLVALLIWEGNRRLYLRIGRPLTPAPRSWSALAHLVARQGAFTIAATTGLLLCWRSAFAVDTATPAAMALAVALSAAVVAVITHGYETVVLRRHWESERVRATHLERAQLQAQLSALQLETDPHALYNHLNSLLHLIESSPPRAAEFVEALAGSYRHVLAMRGKTLVPLSTELEGLRHYHALARIRFKEAVRLDCAVCPDHGRGWWLPPLSLPELAENAIKHTIFDERRPLHIRVWIDGDSLCVSNPFRPRAAGRTSTGVGLANLNQRIHLTTGRAVQWGVEDGEFIVRVPLAPRPTWLGESGAPLPYAARRRVSVPASVFLAEPHTGPSIR